ncbi:MAG: peptidase M48 [Puniceicoccaceae bacterium MED-G30]|nr:MAG: peptidase M48 [Puniceicoccaceae bacterium MED-G30]
MNTVWLLVVLLLLAKTAASLILDALNLQYCRKCAGEVPEAFRGFIDAQAYEKSIDYTVAKARFGMLNDAFDTIVLLCILSFGFLPWAYDLASSWFGYGIWGQSVVLLGLLFVLSLPGLPFEWWHTFRIEERFGFNKSTTGLWLSDKGKGLFLAFLIGCPLLALLLFLVESAGVYWWVWGFAAFFLFQLILVVAFPMFIMPLFNKMEPLEDGSLRERLFALSDRTGFLAQTILKMDGSRRSTHSNAFFAGFGRFRRIVLYDTLMEQMNEEELEAVLAHEIGHYKLGHIPKMVALSAVSGLVMFAALGWLTTSPWFAQAFFFSEADSQALVPVLLLFMILSGFISFWLSPLSSALSRKHEYEADAFARNAVGGAEPLISALRNLHEKNLSNLTPHPLYSAFHYSHPTLLERESALQSVAQS